MAVIFFDIDGTLAEGTKVPASAAAAVGRARAAGHLVFICTGRPRRYAQEHFGTYADGFVCSNGRLAVRNDNVVISEPLSQEQVSAITDVLDRFDAGYAFCAKDDLYYGGNPAYRQEAHKINGPTLELVDALEQGVFLYNLDVYFGEVGKREAIAQALGNMCLVNPHGPHPSADITIRGYDKGNAVRDVTAALGLPHEDSYAFGDGINDLSMIRAAAHGVAMGNAVDEVKAAAEFVTTDIQHDGVANGLAHYGLA